MEWRILSKIDWHTSQVENLTGKSQILEAELERSSRKLKEVTAVAEGEAEKCKAAKEVIKSLTAQVSYFLLSRLAVLNVHFTGWDLPSFFSFTL